MEPEWLKIPKHILEQPPQHVTYTEMHMIDPKGFPMPDTTPTPEAVDPATQYRHPHMPTPTPDAAWAVFLG